MSAVQVKNVLPCLGSTFPRLYGQTVSKSSSSRKSGRLKSVRLATSQTSWVPSCALALHILFIYQSSFDRVLSYLVEGRLSTRSRAISRRQRTQAARYSLVELVCKIITSEYRVMLTSGAHKNNLADDSVGYFVQPTVILSKDPKSITFQEEIFGPVISVSLVPLLFIERRLTMMFRFMYSMTKSTKQP